MNPENRNAAPLLPLETDRLTIRQYREEDAQAYFRLYSNPRVSCFLGEKTDSLEAARREVGQRMLLKDGSELAVCLKETGEWIGTVFGMWEGDTFSVCWNFLPEFGGMGYAHGAAQAYLIFLFREMGARRIYAYVEDTNLPSQRLCRRLGMRQEGLFVEFVSFVNNPDGTPRYENTMQFAILKKEWDQLHP